MCQAKVLLQSDDDSQQVMENVIHMRIEGDTVSLSRFFEHPEILDATVKEVDFLKHTITMVPLAHAEKDWEIAKDEDLKKLRILLPHWIEHNTEHASEFREWAAKAGVAKNDLQIAAQKLENTNHTLEIALSKIKQTL